jgi:hypothetical protein
MSQVIISDCLSSRAGEALGAQPRSRLKSVHPLWNLTLIRRTPELRCILQIYRFHFLLPFSPRYMGFEDNTKAQTSSIEISVAMGGDKKPNVRRSSGTRYLGGNNLLASDSFLAQFQCLGRESVRK